jgi:arginyl-tRNA synthetase
MRAADHLKRKLADTVAGMGYAYPDKATIEPPKDAKFGDLATNLALVLAKEVGKKPRDLALAIQAAVQGNDPEIDRVEVAGPGFLNFFFSRRFWQETAIEVLARGERYGSFDLGRGKAVQVEFVSANPTGPLHIGHGRGAAVGDSLARILRFMGYRVSTEYYINDAGRQMRLLGVSIWMRYNELHGRPFPEPEDYYRGDYIRDLAREILDARGAALLDLPEAEALDECYQYGMDAIMAGIKTDLAHFRVHHDVWFSEKSLVSAGTVESTLADLKNRGLAYEQDGALWFNSTRYGDDKDRVLRKSSGELTYFASDIAYHANKYGRGFDTVVDIWGADHHGYIPRMKAAVQALGRAPDDLQVILVQLVNLLRGGVQVAMSTRAGEFETLADVCAEVGVDSARFIFLSRKSDSHLDFDLELVKQQSMDNPVYYVQYAHARIASVLRKGADLGVTPGEPDLDTLAGLDTPEDLELLKLLEQFPDVAASAAATLSPHHVGYYLRELAGRLHRYYTLNPILTAPESRLVRARLNLMRAVAQTLRNGLGLLGVEAPEKM